MVFSRLKVDIIFSAAGETLRFRWDKNHLDGIMQGGSEIRWY